MAKDPKKIGPYEVQDVIGSGGMGVVYRAVQPALKRFVAIKVLPEHLARNKEYVERFTREARSVAALDHPSIVSIYDIGECGGAYYFVMKYLVGDTLEEYVTEEGPVPLDKALLFMSQLTEALGTAHSSGVIHRDVKPANIIIQPREDRAVLTDFGIALTLEETRLTQPGTMFGSPIYIAPEQLEGDDVDHRADFYSLGSVLYQMLAGRPPYQAKMPVAILHQRIRDPERSVREINPEVPEAADRLVQRLMARNPDDRFQQASELLVAIAVLREDADRLEAQEMPSGPPPTVALERDVDLPPEPPAPVEPPSPPATFREEPAPDTVTAGGWHDWFEGRRVLVGWIGAMAVLALILTLAVWWGGDKGDEQAVEPLESQALLQPGDGGEETGEPAEAGAVVTEEETGDEKALPVEEATGAKTGGPAAVAGAQREPAQEKTTGPSPGEEESTAGDEAGELPAAAVPPQPTEVERTPKKPDPKPSVPSVSREEVATALDAARTARQEAELTGAPDLAPGPWGEAVGKLEQGDGHRSDQRPDLEKQAYVEAEALFGQAAEQAAAEQERRTSETGQEEVLSLLARFDGDLAVGSEAGLEAAGQALARIREIAPDHERLPASDTRLADARQRFWQSHGISRSFTIAPGVEMEFNWVPPGTFRMGTVSKKHSTHSDESPKHTVVIGTGFWMGTYEVTQAQWQAVMGNNPSHFKGPQRPVNRISWNDAQAFVEKLNSTAGAGRFRLPTEAEWEFICRAGTSRSFCGGEINTMGCKNEDHLAPWAWYCYNSDNAVHPVGQKRPNAWGFHDMHGNVGEWCADYYDQNYYEYTPTRDPRGPDSGKTRILRGGGWDFRAWDCRSASRKNFRPSANNNSFGLRLVRIAD